MFESVFYLPKGMEFSSLMETSAAKMPEGCFGFGVEAGVVHDAHDPDACKARGIAAGTAKSEMLRILGRPSASCVEYSRAAHHGRLRMVCFANGKVETLFRRWM